MRKIQFRKKVQLHSIDYGMGRVSFPTDDYLDENDIVYLVGHFDKGKLINTVPQYNEDTVAVFCREKDYIVI